MKKITKILTLVVLLFSKTAFSSFAEYVGDLQLRLGYALTFHDAAWFLEDKLELVTLDDISQDFTINFANYNFFKINNIVSVGFMENFSFDANPIGYDSSVGFLIGPAIGIQIKDVVRFQMGTGLDYLWSKIYSDGITDIGALGFGYDLQAKFFPNSVFSLVIGDRYTIAFTKSISETSDGEKTTISLDEYSTNTSYKFYIGCSLNLNSN